MFLAIVLAVGAVAAAGLSLWKGSRVVKWLGVAAAVVLLLGAAVTLWWPHVVYLIMPAVYRPGHVTYPIEMASDSAFDAYAGALIMRYDDSAVVRLAGADPGAAERRSSLDHIRRFREAGIRSYEGPQTCLRCHERIRVSDGRGGYRTVSLRDNLTRTAHFTFSARTGFSTYGFNGERVDDFPLGKLDRACGIPGSFTWTGWAVTVKNARGEEFSEGCGQCHVAGQYGPISSAMMPFYRATNDEFATTDCLICHAREYDMNARQVVTDPDGRSRWGQDRRLIAAMSVGTSSADECLRCHQHNLGGDSYAPSVATGARGSDRPRLMHTGAKRGTPFGADWDVHAAAGMDCLDCHTARGHQIARGTRGVDLVANDLPDVEVTCERCHGEQPHRGSQWAAMYNMHTAKLACETCHIRRLFPDNVVVRDWSKPVFNEAEGIWVPTNVALSGEPGEGITYRWFNGLGTFMANALGDNPDGEGRYRALHTTPNQYWAGVKDFDYTADYETTFRPIARQGTSKIWPFKRFQAVMYEDLNNQGPYGGMLLPFDYATYYTTGDPVAAVAKAAQSPIMRKMYGAMFKWYMMDDFMKYMAVAGWDTHFDIQRIAPTAMRNEATLMINHAIQKQGRACDECHSARGILDFEALGYSAERAAQLRQRRF
jgi:hypothetical protein